MARKTAMREGENGLERQCSTCNAWFPATLEHFYSHQGGLTGRCKNCIRAASSEWQRANPEKANAKNRKWTKANPEKVRGKSTKRARANPERHRLTSQKWRDKNPERTHAIVMKWVRANPEKHKANSQQWRQENPEKQALNRTKRRALQLGAEGSHTLADIDALFVMQGGLCCWCSETLNIRTIDHIIPLTRMGSDYPSNIVICCKSCNSSKKDKVVFVHWQPRKILECMLEHVLNALKTET